MHGAWRRVLSYYDASFETHWRVLQAGSSSGTETLKTDRFAVTFAP